MRSLHTPVAAGVLALLITSVGAQQPQPPAPPAPPVPLPVILRNYKPVTTERLKRPEDSGWLGVRRT